LRGSAPESSYEAAPELGGHGVPFQNWQERTQNTLRIVLTDPDHRPHLVAGLVVCAAAALVIFISGRSPVAGTGVLGQATRSLSTEPKTGKSPPVVADPAPARVGAEPAAAAP